MSNKERTGKIEEALEMIYERKFQKNFKAEYWINKASKQTGVSKETIKLIGNL